MSHDGEKPALPTSLPEALMLVLGIIFKREALLVIVACIVMVAIGGAGVVWAQSAQKREASEVLEPLARRVQQLEDGGRRHAEESAEVHLELKKDMAELQRDLRELYRVVRDPSRRSERLEQPVVLDGGR